MITNETLIWDLILLHKAWAQNSELLKFDTTNKTN